MSKEVAKKKIVVLGGGFAGLNFIKNIDHKLYDVTLVDTDKRRLIGKGCCGPV